MSRNSSDLSPSNGCHEGIAVEFQYLCSLDAVWGILVIGIAGFGLLLTLLFAVLFSANMKLYVRHQKNRNSAILYFVLLGVFLLFSFSIVFVIQPSLIICVLRRVGIGLAWTVTLASLFVLVTATLKTSYLEEIRCCWLSFAVTCCICVEIIIVVEWNILRPPYPTSDIHFRCEENEYDLLLALIFNGVLLLMFLISSVISACRKDNRILANHTASSQIVSSLVTSILVILLSAAWSVMLAYGNRAFEKETEWSDPATGMFMVVSGLVILLVMFSPILHTMRKIRQREGDCIPDFEENHPSMARMSYGSSKTRSNYPDHRTCSYGTTEDFERVRNSKQNGEGNAMAMSDLSFIKPTPAKRTGGNSNVDRVRAPTSGHVNHTLELDEEDIWRNQMLGV
ncbi:G-protein coupled receptor family C group 5 member B-like [Clavelina lepadiformis]|uniref:G-protein coupled receptor family C group 5 member B-like n=1 Tax=Clavelina lepadiformis TaxID=159417 RepID=UPI0040437C0A